MRIKNIITLILVSSVIVGFSLAQMIKTPEQYSMTERRVLAQKPELSVEQLISGKFMSQFEEYTLDQFPMRDTFRSIKANASRSIFLRKDNNGFYYAKGHLSKLEYPLNDVKIANSISKIDEIYKKYLSKTDCKMYLSIIPDKNYFLAPLSNHITMDYDLLENKMRDNLRYLEYIDIFDKLSLDDYYHTDQHWKQENLKELSEYLLTSMNMPVNQTFEDNLLEKPFYGTYYGQASLNIQPDEIHYLTNEITDSCVVTSYSTGLPKQSVLYDFNKANGKDPYEMFLSGSEPLLVIENTSSKSNRELVIFRDSFASSLTPLMISDYSKIILIDLRYIQSSIIDNFVNFSNQDVLFLYSTLVLNNNISM